MSDHEPSSTAESPFLDTYRTNAPSEAIARPPACVSIRIASPFLHELDGEVAGPDGLAETVAELRADLYRREFDVAVHELIGEAAAIVAERGPVDTGDPVAHAARVERLLAEHFAPLQRGVDQLAARLVEQLGPIDAASLGETELDQLLDPPVAETDGLSPASARFLQEIEVKVKQAARSGARTKKKHGGGLLLRGVLKKLGRIVGTVLRHVLAHAAHKLPPQYREVIAKLRARFAPRPRGSLPAATPRAAEPSAATEPSDPAAPEPAIAPGAAASPATPPAPDGAAAPDQPTAADVGDVQNELDARLSELLLAQDEAEQETASGEREQEVAATDPLGELERGRARFMGEIGALGEGEDATPAVENFVPVILGAIKIGVRLIGRKRVVGFLGNLIGKLIAPLAGKNVAPALGRLIADLGLRVLVHAEVAPPQAAEVAAHAAALTVEDTVRSVAALPEHVLADDEMLETRTIEAFERAAAANFPPAMVRSELREAEVDGTWIALPLRGRRYYKRFSRSFDVVIGPQIARHVRTFGGGTLAAFLRDRHHLVGEEPVRARIHLFEPLEGGRLHDILQHERLRGAGIAGEAGWKLLHPLTIEAASALLQHPGLGRPAPHVLDPLRPLVGQRLYYLEIEGPPVRAGHACHLHATLDFARDEITVCLYLSEVIAQEIATQLRQHARPASIIKRLREVYASEIGLLASVENYRLLRVVLADHDPRPAATLGDAARHALRRELGRQLTAIVPDWVWAGLIRYFAGPVSEFVLATERPAEGVKIIVGFQRPPGLQALRAAIRGGASGEMHEWPPRHVPAATVRVVPGDARCSP